MTRDPLAGLRPIRERLDVALQVLEQIPCADSEDELQRDASLGLVRESIAALASLEQKEGEGSQSSQGAKKRLHDAAFDAVALGKDHVFVDPVDIQYVLAAFDRMACGLRLSDSALAGGEGSHEFALEEAALALMQVHGGPGVPRRYEASVAIEAYLRARESAPAGSQSDGEAKSGPLCECGHSIVNHVRALEPHDGGYTACDQLDCDCLSFRLQPSDGEVDHE